MADSKLNKGLYRVGREADQTLLIDDDKYNLSSNQRSMILISKWVGDPKDEDLKLLMPVLEAVARADTVQDVMDVHLTRQRQGNFRDLEK